MGYVISKEAWEDESKHDAIITLVDYLYSQEVQESALYNEGSIPSRVDMEIDESKVTVPMLAEIIEYAKGKESCPNFPQTCPNAGLILQTDLTNYWQEYPRRNKSLKI